MSKDVPSAPPPPDPYATAQAQTGANVNTAVANSWLQNANENGPLGSVKYDQTGSKQIHDPNRDAYGNLNGTFTDYDIPTFTRTQTLSPAQQQMLTSQQQLGQQLLNMGNAQAGKVNNILSTNFNVDDVKGIKDLGDPNLSRDAVEQAMYARINPQLDRERNALDAKVVGEGFQRGTTGYDEAMNQYGRMANDARQQVTVAGGAEQSRQLAANLAQRQQAIQEAVTERQLPLNEIIGMMNGTQINMPQFAQYNPGTVAQTPLADSVYKSADIASRNWQTQAQMAQQSNAGMFGLGSSALGGLFKFGLGGGAFV